MIEKWQDINSIIKTKTRKAGRHFDPVLFPSLIHQIISYQSEFILRVHDLPIFKDDGGVSFIYKANTIYQSKRLIRGY